MTSGEGEVIDGEQSVSLTDGGNITGISSAQLLLFTVWYVIFIFQGQYRVC